MEEQEFRHWAKIEEDIKRLQNERLNLLQSALVEREKEIEEKHSQRIEEIRLRKTETKERSIAKIQRKRIKVLRKMFKARKNVDTKGKRRDIIEDYSNFAVTINLSRPFYQRVASIDTAELSEAEAADDFRGVFSVHSKHLRCDPLHPSRLGGRHGRMARRIPHRRHLLPLRKYRPLTLTSSHSNLFTSPPPQYNVNSRGFSVVTYANNVSHVL